MNTILHFHLGSLQAQMSEYDGGSCKQGIAIAALGIGLRWQFARSGYFPNCSG